MKRSDILSYLTPKTVLAGGLGVFILIFLWRFLTKKKAITAEEVANSEYVQNVIQVSSERMNNGRTYYEVATDIYNALWNKFNFLWWPVHYFFNDTDEKMLGNLMLSVMRDEYPRLSDTYNIVRKADNNPDNESLVNELTRTFNKTEQRKYLSHLFDNL